MDPMEEEEDVVPSPMKPSSLEVLEEDLVIWKNKLLKADENVNYWSNKVEQAVFGSDEQKFALQQKTEAQQMVLNLMNQIQKEKELEQGEPLFFLGFCCPLYHQKQAWDNLSKDFV